MLKFRFWGVPAQISVPFCAAVCLICWFDRTGTMRACMAAAAVHELAHLAAMRLLHWAACEVRFTAWGIRLVRRERIPYPYGAECAVLLAGPAANLLLAAGFACAGRWTPGGAAQLSLGLFNLLPVTPLDGGQALHAALRRVLPLRRADRVADFLTLAVLLPLMALLILQLLRQRMNWSLLASVVYLMIFFVVNHGGTLAN